ncbi:coiled-coil domain-containing protein 14 isoform X2 [Anarrhichthys ocellatus]|uniref:coiled-coil domain-containing protein 14 isoform X2 n=1 Tax=Anarrhichthys ocellatus TaxID=433405 RepID=UPI0012ED7C30|nr:coiled-coil domain-containing protein 14 isoform X2 [Anarrhichthys ocellatus]
MKGTAKSKVVTSGRLTGGVKGQRSRRRGTPDPGPAACPGPAYSLYSTSTDSEEQVSSLHEGLDQCAALLTDILQAEKAVKGGAAKSTPCSSLWKKTIRNTKTEQRGWQPGPGSTTRHPAVKTSTHPPEKRTSIHPPEKRTSIHPPEKRTSIHPPEKRTSTHPPQTSTHLLEKQTSIHPPEKQTSTHPPQTSTHPPEKQTSTQTSTHPLEKQTSIHPPEKQTSTHPPQTSTHPPEKQTSTHPPEKQTSTHPPQTSIHPLEKHTSTHPPQTSIFPGRPQTSISISYCEAECDREEEEFVPVRDIDVQSSAVRPMWTMKMSNMQLELGQVDKVPQDCSAETDRKGKTVQYLLGELKALIAGQGSVAERLLSHLEQTVSSPLMDAGSSNIRTEPQQPSHHMQNTQLRRRVRTLNQQLKQRGTAESHQNLEMLCNPEVWTLQEELGTAQSRLQDLQEDLAGLRNALEDTRSRLTDREAKNALLQTDLEATRSRLLDSKREKSEMASLAQQRLEDIGNLNRILQCEQHCNQHQHRPDPAEPPTDRISQFLMSLGQPVCVSAEREGKTLRDTSSHPAVGPQRGDKDPSHGSDGVQSCVEERSRLSRCHVESLCSDWSTRSGSSFDTRDEVAFRDGLAALDASIASLQKTMRLDLGS